MGYTIELCSIPTIKNLVANEMGVSFLPRFVIEEELKSGVLEEIKIDMTNASISAVLAYHKNKWVSPLMQLFIDLCKKAVLRFA